MLHIHQEKSRVFEIDLQTKFKCGFHGALKINVSYKKFWNSDLYRFIIQESNVIFYRFHGDFGDMFYVI